MRNKWLGDISGSTADVTMSFSDGAVSIGLSGQQVVSLDTKFETVVPYVHVQSAEATFCFIEAPQPGAAPLSPVATSAR